MNGKVKEKKRGEYDIIDGRWSLSFKHAKGAIAESGQLREQEGCRREQKDVIVYSAVVTKLVSERSGGKVHWEISIYITVSSEKQHET